MASPATAVMTPQPEDMAAPVDRTSTSDSAATPASATAPADAVRTLRERLDRRERWRRTKTDDADARASLVAAARSGDDEAQAELANRLIVCPDKKTDDASTSNVEVPASKSDGSKPKTSEDAFAEICARWTAQTTPEERDWRGWRDRAADAGNGMALMARTADEKTLDAATRREALRKAWLTHDPAVAEYLVAQASSDPDYRGELRVGGGPGFFFGSYLAQCQLGADCSRDSAAFQRWCRRGGMACESATSLDALFEQRLSPAQFRIAREQADALARAFDGPPEDSPEGRSLLRTIDRTPTPEADR